MKTSCGFLIKSAGLYLVCHATRLKHMPDISDVHWSISKGQSDPGETDLQTAIRELQEETDLNILKYMTIKSDLPLLSVFEVKKKTIKVFFLNDESGILQTIPLKCNSIMHNHPDTRYNLLPEMDDFKWVTKEEGFNMVFESQKHLFQLEGI